VVTDDHVRETLRAPVAVRLVDLDRPRELDLARDGERYRAAILVAVAGGIPVGTATVAIDGGDRISAQRLRSLIASHRFTPPPPRPAGGTLPEVSVVISTCARTDAVLATLASALACEPPPAEVIVVENRPIGSDVGAALARRFGPGSRVRYLEEERRGLAAARNAGLHTARSELVAFTDDDVALDRAWVGWIARAFASQPDAACVTGLILPGDLLTHEQVLLEQFAGFGKGYERRVHRLATSSSPLHPFAPGEFGSGASTALRVDVARSLQGFDAALGTGTAARGAEDLDMYLRILLAGHALVYEPAAMLWHQHPDQPRELERRLFDYGVSLSAMLTKYALSGYAAPMLRRLPAAARHLTSADSRKNAGKGPEYPHRLDWTERAGMAIGPLAYGASKLRERRAGYAPTGIPPPGRAMRASFSFPTLFF